MSKVSSIAGVSSKLDTPAFNDPKFALADPVVGMLVKDFYDPTAAIPTGGVIGDVHVASATANGWTVNRIYTCTAIAGAVAIVEDAGTYTAGSMSATWFLNGSATAHTTTVAYDTNKATTIAALATAWQVAIRAAIAGDAASTVAYGAPTITVTPKAGNYVIVTAVGWTGLAGNITILSITGPVRTWTATIPLTGQNAYNVALGRSYKFDGTSWIAGTASALIDQPVTSAAGISSPVYNVSKEGIGTGGYDTKFNVF